VHLRIDQIYLSEVLDNILSNAIKYSNKGTKIKVNIKYSDGMVLTEIIDNGIGIREEDLGSIFEPFKTTRNKPTNGEVSTGLGLTLVKKIITLHGGRIEVKSRENEGSTFYYYLPVET
jgi:signal transduction histidine kinase